MLASPTLSFSASKLVVCTISCATLWLNKMIFSFHFFLHIGTQTTQIYVDREIDTGNCFSTDIFECRGKKGGSEVRRKHPFVPHHTPSSAIHRITCHLLHTYPPALLGSVCLYSVCERESVHACVYCSVLNTHTSIGQ